MSLKDLLLASMFLLTATPALADWQDKPSPVPCQWEYKFNDAGVSTATYCGIVETGTTQSSCDIAANHGFVNDGVTANDAALASYVSGTKNMCLQLDQGKYLFNSHANVLLAPYAQTLNVTSGTYNPANGYVTLQLSAPVTFPIYSPINVWGLTGTGSFARLNGAFKVIASFGSTVTYATSLNGLTATITGGFEAGAASQSLTLKGAGNNSTSLFWPNSGGGMTITQGGTSSTSGVYASNVHIRDLAFTTGQVGADTALDLEGFPFAFGVASASDVTNVDFHGDDFLPPNHGSMYWGTDWKTNCWSNVNGKYVGSYGLGATGVGITYGCSQANTYATTFTFDHGFINGHQFSVDLLSWWQGVFITNNNFGSANGTGSVGIVESTGQAGDLSGLVISGNQMGGLDFPISLAPSTGVPVFNAQITNNIVYEAANNGIAINLGAPGNPTFYSLIANNACIGNNNAGSYCIIMGGQESAITGNVGNNIPTGMVLQSGSSKVTVTGNSIPGSTTSLINDGCTGCVIANNVGINPLGVSAGTYPIASNGTYTAGPTAETHYLSGGTITVVKVPNNSGQNVCLLTPCTVELAPNETFSVTYTVAPNDVVAKH